ncbi:CinA family protein [bacterium]|nr:CinA family protein [bacterium]
MKGKQLNSAACARCPTSPPSPRPLPQLKELLPAGRDTGKLRAFRNTMRIYCKSDSIAILEEEIGRLLREKGLTLSCAESCTGGLLSHRITNTCGSSNYFKGAVLAYSNQVKTNLLGVPEEMLLKYGAVSSQVAKRMAEGVASLLGADISLSITGIAGPSGGSKEKPVGLVYEALFDRGETLIKRFRFEGSREEIKEKAATASLEMLGERLGIEKDEV